MLSELKFVGPTHFPKISQVQLCNILPLLGFVISNTLPRHPAFSSSFHKSIDIDEVNSAEYAHNEFWLNQRDLVRTMDSLVEDYMDEDEEREESYDSDDILFTS